ncbi:MAG: hypothetical protein C4551_05170 [Bacillota bacterium]|nr:MAG: hypothetical protein C4551_05170 [Bacillota bacterium]
MREPDTGQARPERAAGVSPVSRAIQWGSALLQPGGKAGAELPQGPGRPGLEPGRNEESTVSENLSIFPFPSGVWPS